MPIAHHRGRALSLDVVQRYDHAPVRREVHDRISVDQAESGYALAGCGVAGDQSNYACICELAQGSSNIGMNDVECLGLVDVVIYATGARISLRDAAARRGNALQRDEVEPQFQAAPRPLRAMGA